MTKGAHSGKQFLEVLLLACGCGAGAGLLTWLILWVYLRWIL
jgi:hypothetical protein